MVIKKNARRILYTEAVILFVCFTLFVFAPFEIYLSSKDSFFFEGYELIGFFALAFCASFLCVSFINVLTVILSEKVNNLFFAMAFSIGMALYIQGNFILADYGQLDGNAINWADFKMEGMISHGVFIVVVLLGFLLLKKVDTNKYMKLGSGVSVCIILIQLVTLSTLVLQSGGLAKESVYVSTTKGEYEYSAKENMFIILMDTFDSKVMRDLLESEDARECNRVLENFTYYPDASTVYSNTRFSVPNIISGVQAQEGMSFDEFITDAFEKNVFFAELADKGWECRAYTDIQLPKSAEEMAFDNIEPYTLTVSSHRRLGEYMLKLIGFRYLPQCLKEYCWFYSDDMNSMMRIDSAEGHRIFSWTNLEFYEGIGNITAENENGVYCFYHLEGTHVPFKTNRDLSYSDSEGTIQEEGMAMMTLLDSFFTELKEQDIYDNSVIVVLADHGYYDYRQNSVFLVKGKNEEHPFAVSDRKVSFENLQETYRNLLQGMEAESAVVEYNGERVFYDIDKERLRQMKIAGTATETDNLLYTDKILYVE